MQELQYWALSENSVPAADGLIVGWSSMDMTPQPTKILNWPSRF